MGPKNEHEDKTEIMVKLRCPGALTQEPTHLRAGSPPSDGIPTTKQKCRQHLCWGRTLGLWSISSDGLSLAVPAEISPFIGNRSPSKSVNALPLSLSSLACDVPPKTLMFFEGGGKKLLFLPSRYARPGRAQNREEQ